MFVRPLRETFALIATSPAAWVTLLVAALIYGGQHWTTAEISVGLAGDRRDDMVLWIGLMTMFAPFAELALRWVWTRQFAGPTALRGRFWPWFGVMLGTQIIYGVTTLALTLGMVGGGAEDSLFLWQTGRPALWVVLSLILLPATIWATACALGKRSPFLQMHDLPPPGFWGYVANFLLLSLVVRAVSMGGYAVAAPLGAVASVTIGLVIAISFMLSAAFHAAAAKHLGNDARREVDVFS
jgi:hypothetical protein